jgi:hypothetical protein
MAQSGKLTALKIAALARAKKPGFYGDGVGLYLQIRQYARLCKAEYSDIAWGAAARSRPRQSRDLEPGRGT